MTRVSPIRHFSIVTLLLVVSFSGAAVAQSSDDFNIILLPDTQYYSESYPQIYLSQTQWIVDHLQDMNIQFVIGLGDIVNNGSSLTQWQNADNAVHLLDGNVPYFMAIGNRDYDGINPALRGVVNFNQYFGPSRYQNYSWYRGSFPDGSNENFYGVVNVNGQDYLILALEFVPRTAALNWASSIIDANPDKEIIVVTHSNVFKDNTRIDVCDTTEQNVDNDGDETWANLVGQKPNVIMVVSGHIVSSPARRVDLGLNENLVNQMLSNYQGLTNGGNGYLRILTVQPSLNRISVKTYSPYLNLFLTDSRNKFTINLHKPQTSTAGTATITGRARIARIGSKQDCQAIADVTIANSSASVATNTAGQYSLTAQAPDNVAVTATKTDWKNLTQNAQVWSGYPTQLEFFMTPQQGQISGVVRNTAGVPIKGAAIKYVGGIVSMNKTVKTDSLGQYSSGPVPVGSYTLTVTKTGYITQTLTTTVAADTTSAQDVVLSK
jgi:hypothetical protein